MVKSVMVAMLYTQWISKDAGCNEKLTKKMVLYDKLWCTTH